MTVPFSQILTNDKLEKHLKMNEIIRNNLKYFEIRPAKSGQITKMDNVFLTTSSIRNYGLDYLTDVDKSVLNG